VDEEQHDCVKAGQRCSVSGFVCPRYCQLLNCVTEEIQAGSRQGGGDGGKPFELSKYGQGSSVSVGFGQLVTALTLRMW